ncbi:metallophosphoesterase [Robertkochia solimangrovi]|uniref:metallophosphoesterase n=1 Tax=Robertkochia solimangrovi TaxID=2213046 RepID=UPI00117D452F|nr:metallophosphoesterase [Robertkochia solimangrovi]TRZ41194.1 serine/threonine protein phosphatase [Robertkochia solimangrovi]
MFSASHRRFEKAFAKAPIINFDDGSKFVFFSDCHRGDNSFADEFANNRNIYFHALKYYFQENFTYIELGDGDELWENHRFHTILEAHKNVYALLKDFHDNKRLYMLYGNHDMVHKDSRYVKRHYDTWYDPNLGEEVSFMPGLLIHEAIRLKHTQTGQEIFLVHGHQADTWNYTFWRFARLMVRVLWRPLQVVGISDPTSPARNNLESFKIEKRTKRWITFRKNLFTIVGHTHRPRFPEPGDLPLFNDGCCVHPRSITGIEFVNGEISLIKWYIDTTDEGYLQIVRTVLEGPQKIADYH